MSAPIVLVVDDNRQNVELLEAYLATEDYEVMTAYDGDEALASVAERAPDIVLLDIMMPNVNGYDVCRELKRDSRTQFIPVVMVTALKERDDKLKGIEVGADDFLTKPIDRVELLTRIRSLIRVKRLHDELDQSYRELKELEHTKDRLTQMIIHDLKNPLTGIKANLEIVGMDVPRDSHDCLSAAQRSCDLLFNMIQDLLDISRMEEGQLQLQPERLDLEELMATVADEYRVPAEAEGKEISTEASPGASPVSGDRDLLFRVLSNLVANAVKHTGRGGSIKVRADAEGTYLRVSVEDTGYGIPAEHLERIFEKFSQIETRQRAGGTGLGLTFCKMAVEAHGGRIWVESEEGRGSAFIFVLPMSDSDA